jgi:hypothetical protein
MRGKLRTCTSLDMKLNHSHHSFWCETFSLAFGCAHKRWKKSFQKREREKEGDRVGAERQGAERQSAIVVVGKYDSLSLSLSLSSFFLCLS